MDYMITKKQILLINTAIYEDINNGILVPKELEGEELLRTAVLVDNHLIDFKTGDEIYPIETSPEGYIRSTIFAHTMYVTEAYEHPNVTDEHLLYAAQIYEEYLEKQKLIKERKLILFPRRCLFYNK